MAEFLTTAMTRAYIERLIEEAKSSLVFITPYVQISETVFQRMQDASKRKVSMTFVYGKADLKSEEHDTLKKIPGLKLFYFENLHAKCYYNEDKLIITSMNLYEFSSKNREMGILLERRIDKELYEKAILEAASIINHAEQKILNSFIKTNQKIATQEPDAPYNKKENNGLVKTRKSAYAMANCIRCGTLIDFDPSKPFCAKCYKAWKQYENTSYLENFCHGCDKQPVETSMEKPFCYTCYKKYAN